MGIIGKQTIRSTVYSYLGIAVGFVTIGLLMPNIFTTAQNGLIGLLISYAVLAANIGQLGFNSATVKYFPIFRNEAKNHHGYLVLSILIALIGSVLAVVTIWLLQPYILQQNGGQSAQLATYFWSLPPLIFFHILFSAFDTYARMRYDAVSGTFYKEFIMRLLVLLAVGVYGAKWITFSSFISFWVILQAVPTLLMMFEIHTDGHFSWRIDWGIWNLPLVKEVATYSLFAMISGMSGVILVYLEPILVNHYLGLSDTGIFRICAVFGMVIVAPARMLYRISATVIAEAWQKQNLKTIQIIYQKSSLMQLLIGCLVYVGIVANLHNVFECLPNAYRAGYWVIVIYGLGSLVEMAFGANGVIVGTSKYYRFDTLFLILLLISSLLLNAWLIPVFGIVGCSMASFLCVLMFNMWRSGLLYFKFGLQPFVSQHFKVILVSLFVFGVMYLLPALPYMLLDVLVRSLLITLLFGGIIYFLKLSGEFNQQIEGIWRLIVQVITWK